MNKVKMFFVAAALLLTTAGVFAGKAKFAAFPVYAYNTSSHTFVTTPVSTSVNSGSWVQGSGSGGAQAFITDATGNQFPIYYSQSVSNPIFVITTF